MSVRIVTDSAADLPPELAASEGIQIVPLSVRFGSQSYLSGVELEPDEFWRMLESSDEAPSTAAPSAGDFQKTYQKLVDEGATGIVSVHLSSKLSATYQSATVAAKEFAEVPIEIIDTLAVSAGTGLTALVAAEQARQGSSAADIAQSLAALAPRVHLYGTLDTLEYLRKGGRIGGAQALLGTMLKVKPVIGLEDGVVDPVGRVRTRGRALEHLAGLAAEHKGNIDRLVAISGRAQDIDTFLELLSAAVDMTPEVWPFGPVVGTHAGPGVIGVSYITRQ